MDSQYSVHRKIYCGMPFQILPLYFRIKVMEIHFTTRYIAVKKSLSSTALVLFLFRYSPCFSARKGWSKRLHTFHYPKFPHFPGPQRPYFSFCWHFPNCQLSILSDYLIDFPTVSFVRGSATTSLVSDIRVHIVTFHLGRVGQLSSRNMLSYLHWEYLVEVSQHQHSLLQMRPKEIHNTSQYLHT